MCLGSRGILGWPVVNAVQFQAHALEARHMNYHSKPNIDIFNMYALISLVCMISNFLKERSCTFMLST